MNHGSSTIRTIFALCSLALTLSFAGCGPGAPTLYDVKGKVSFEGSPLTDGNITFESPGAGIAETAEIKADGTYTVKLIEGTYIVTLLPVFVEQKSEDGTMEDVLKDEEKFPEKYQMSESSGLSVTVSSETTFDVDMTAE